MTSEYLINHTQQRDRRTGLDVQRVKETGDGEEQEATVNTGVHTSTVFITVS